MKDSFLVGCVKHLHLARFRWFIREITKLRCPYDSVLELGCFDGKVIDFCPKKPMRYKVSMQIGSEDWIKQKRSGKRTPITHSLKPVSRRHALRGARTI